GNRWTNITRDAEAARAAAAAHTLGKDPVGIATNGEHAASICKRDVAAASARAALAADADGSSNTFNVKSAGHTEPAVASAAADALRQQRVRMAADSGDVSEAREAYASTIAAAAALSAETERTAEAAGRSRRRNGKTA